MFDAETVRSEDEPARKSDGDPRAGDEGPHSLIGRYKLLQIIGEGGFGEVWMAEQQEPVVRKVALKIIKLGMDTKEVVARFEAERQALALMDHPHIAKVFDGGATESGRPYFVMELVRGVPITRYADKQQLDTAARLDLLVDVCSAVQHAHQKGIIHRDLKPSNILVSIEGSRAVPKVIDFGIAKATQQRLTEKTLFTRMEQFVGTPAYMSPEQAEMSGLDIDTRSDIYSLGILLYELLTGHPPFDVKVIMLAGLDELRRVIREEEPARPSTRVSTMADGDRATVARARTTAPEKLGRILRGDLDWIVMKAIEKDRARRYETANALAEDIRRFRRSEPVSAAAPSVVYRFSRFLRRNRAAAMVAAVIVVLLVGGTTVSVLQALRALRAERDSREKAASEERARESAEANELKARRETEKALRAVAMMRGIFESADPDLIKDPAYSVKQLLDDFASRDRWEELKEEPEIERLLRATIGRAYLNLGRFPEAREHVARELALGLKLDGGESGEVTKTMLTLAYVLRLQDKPDETEAMYRRVVAATKRIYGNESAEVARAMAGLANVLTDRRAYAEARVIHEEALAMRTKLFGNDHPEVADSLANLALVLGNEGKLDEAEAMIADALDTHLDTGDVGDLRLRGLGLNSKAQVLAAQGKYTEAEAIYREILEMGMKHLGKSNPFLGVPAQGLGYVLEMQGRLPEAEELYRQALDLGESVPGDEHIIVTQVRANLAQILVKRGQTREAELLFRKNVELHRKLRGDEAVELADALNAHAECLRSLRRFDEALEAHRGTLAIRRKVLGDQSAPVAISLNNIGMVLEESGQLAEAEAKVRESVEILDGLDLGRSPDGMVVHRNLLRLLLALDRKDEAAELEAAVFGGAVARTAQPMDAAPEIGAVLVPPDAEWRWIHPEKGRDPAQDVPNFHTTFFNADFDDSRWASGQDGPGLGEGFAYGETDFKGVDLIQPVDTAHRNSAYFRLHFTTTADAERLELRCHRDDGFIAYLDGVEVVRDNLPSGSDAYKLHAVETIQPEDEMTVFRFPIDTPLPAGDHVLAISLHNRGLGSSDLGIGAITLVTVE